MQDPALQGWVSHAQNLTVALAPQLVARAAKLGHEGGGEAQGPPSPLNRTPGAQECLMHCRM